MSRYDLVIRGGEILDGTGAPGFHADIALKSGIIVEIGSISGKGHKEIDADGALVTPGFVDIHTHYDGQATWSNRLSPSSHHGVTTAVMGNCGVGFAPVKATDHDLLIELMEGVEDIPGAALHEGLTWEWESFPEYLDYLGKRHFDMDIAAQLPHGALRVYVMGQRGAEREAANSDDIQSMRRLTREALEAGAFGFSSSRTLNHRSSKGAPTPSLTAERDELLGIAQGLKDAGRGVMEFISDFKNLEAEFDLLKAMVRTSGRPMSVSLAQGLSPHGWRKLLGKISQAASEGDVMRGQVAPRAIGILLGFNATLNPFLLHPSYQSILKLPLEQRLRILAAPEFKAKLLSETPGDARYDRMKQLIGEFHKIWELCDPPDYEPAPESSIAARAEEAGQSAEAFAYDLLLQRDGQNLLYTPFANYAEYNLDCCRDMILDEHTVMGLGDGGAHVGTICDASFTTYLLSHWGRDRSRGEKIELPWLVKRQTSDTAKAVGLADRGTLAPGRKADLNVIDFENLRLRAPEFVKDLPAGGKRLEQRAEGYLATIVNGEITQREGQPTEALPGRLLRSD